MFRAGSSMNAFFTDHLSCKICLEILNEPVQCQRNEHYFCKSCLQQHLVRSQTCPLCVEKLTLRTLRPAPRVVAEFVSHLTTPRCDFIHRGCKEKIAIQDIPYHHKICGFAPVLCSNEGCGTTVNRQDVASHENESCNFRKVKCNTCGKKVVFQVGRHFCVPAEVQAVRILLHAFRDVVMEVFGLSNSSQVLQDLLRNVTPSSPIFVASDKSFEIFDWSTKKWTLHEDILFFPHHHSFSFPFKNNIMLLGGTRSNRIEYVNIRKDPITSTSFPLSLPECHGYLGGKGIRCDKRVFVFQNCEVCEIALDSPPSSQAVLNLPHYKQFYGVERINQNIVVLGGNMGEKSFNRLEKALNTVLLYDTSKNEMKTIAPLPYGVSEMATVPYKDNIIILGGKDSNDKPYNSVIMYNIKSQECHRLPSMLQKRSGCAAVIMEKVIIVMGGHSGSECLNTVEYFVLGQDSWHEFPSMCCARYGATACLQP